MKQFEYATRDKPSRAHPEGLVRLLNEMGESGWELCDGDYGLFLFKREITDEVLAMRQAEQTKHAKMRSHLASEHGHSVYIGNVLEVHQRDYPDCAGPQ